MAMNRIASSPTFGSIGQLPTSRMFSRRMSSRFMRWLLGEAAVFDGAGVFAGGAPGAGFAAGVGGAVVALTGIGGAVRFTCRLSVNSLTRSLAAAHAAAPPGIGTSLISTSSGVDSHGELWMLRMSVDTRAFDCA